MGQLLTDPLPLLLLFCVLARSQQQGQCTLKWPLLVFLVGDSRDLSYDRFTDCSVVVCTEDCQLLFWTVQLLRSDKTSAFYLVCLKLCCTSCSSKAPLCHLEEGIFPTPLLHTSVARLTMNSSTKPAPNSGYILPQLKH